MSSESTWYVECQGLANEQIAALLASQGEVGGRETVSLYDSEGEPHNVWLVPSKYVTLLKRAKRDNPTIYGQVRFFLQNTPGGDIHPADFVEKKRLSVGVRKALSDLAQKRKRR